MTSNKNLGNAGEFYVLAQLAQRGYIAGKTDDEEAKDLIELDQSRLVRKEQINYLMHFANINFTPKT